KQRGVTREIGALALDLQQEATRIPTIAAIGKARTMVSQRHGDTAPIRIDSSPQVHGLNFRLRYALRLEPFPYLEVGVHRGTSSRGNRRRIANVIEVAVRNEDLVARDFGGLDWRCRRF